MALPFRLKFQCQQTPYCFEKLATSAAHNMGPSYSTQAKALAPRTTPYLTPRQGGRNPDKDGVGYLTIQHDRTRPDHTRMNKTTRAPEQRRSCATEHARRRQPPPNQAVCEAGPLDRLIGVAVLALRYCPDTTSLSPERPLKQGGLKRLSK